jgi:hypothetical protein
MKRVVLLLCLLLASACGASSAPVSLGASPSMSPSPVPTHTNVPVPPRTGPHFATPQAAMRYLASAWNRNDLVELKHVTDPMARDQLDAMHSEATNLKLDRCTVNQGRGDYECFFTHDYPKGYQKVGHGTAEFTVGPADRPGWYMTYFEECN